MEKKQISNGDKPVIDCAFPGCNRVYESVHASRLHYRAKHGRKLEDLSSTFNNNDNNNDNNNNNINNNSNINVVNSSSNDNNDFSEKDNNKNYIGTKKKRIRKQSVGQLGLQSIKCGRRRSSSLHSEKQLRDLEISVQLQNMLCLNENDNDNNNNNN
eukprot:Pgem_evm1s14292